MADRILSAEESAAFLASRPVESSTLRTGSTATSPDGKPESRPLTMADMEFVIERSAQYVQALIAGQTKELGNRVKELEDEVSKLSWEIDGFRKKAGMPPIRRSFEKVVGIELDEHGRIASMMKEIYEDGAE